VVTRNYGVSTAAYFETRYLYFLKSICILFILINKSKTNQLIFATNPFTQSPKILVVPIVCYVMFWHGLSVHI
jgi:hypothetical protein